MLPQPSTFRRTTDGGRTWQEISLDERQVQTLSVLPSSREVWAGTFRCVSVSPETSCAAEYGVARSTDVGTTWRVAAAPGSVREIDVVGEGLAWAVAYACGDPASAACNAQVLRTEDGAETWTAVRQFGPQEYPQVWAFTASRALVAVQRCTDACRSHVEETNDGGVTWAMRHQQDEVAYVEFDQSGRALRNRGSTSAMEYTHDGTSWQLATLPVLAGHGYIDFLDDNTGWFGASRLMRSNDGGATFTPVGDAPPPDTFDFVNEQDGWGARLICDPACGYRVEILRTPDGGKSWELQATRPIGNYTEGVFRDLNEGWAYSLSERLLAHTVDGGATWVDEPIPLGPGAISYPTIAFGRDRSVWLAETQCDPGFTHCGVVVQASVDGGHTWHPSGSPALSSGCPVQLTALDAQYAWLVGSECTPVNAPIVFRTTDAGATWSRTDLAGSGPVTWLQFFDARIGRGIRVNCTPQSTGCRQELMRTNDGGAAWAYEDTGELISFGADQYRFSSPERAWFSQSLGGGVLAALASRLYRYTGSGTFEIDEPRRPIVAPNTGGRGAGSSDGSAPLLLLAGAALVAMGWLRRPRAR